MVSLVIHLLNPATSNGSNRDLESDNRLIEIPASRKKRLVVLKWLVQKFESDRDYPELELNAILKTYHEDCATLRREFIGYHLMARANGIYRRLSQTEWLEEITSFN